MDIQSRQNHGFSTTMYFTVSISSIHNSPNNGLFTAGIDLNYIHRPHVIRSPLYQSTDKTLVTVPSCPCIGSETNMQYNGNDSQRLPRLTSKTLTVHNSLSVDGSSVSPAAVTAKKECKYMRPLVSIRSINATNGWIVGALTHVSC